MHILRPETIPHGSLGTVERQINYIAAVHPVQYFDTHLEMLHIGCVRLLSTLNHLTV
jgi:hypothetical protein